MALIPQVVGTPTGVASGARAAAAGDTVTPGADVQLVVINAGGVSTTVTVTCKQTCSMGLSSPAHDSVSVVAAGTTAAIGPINDRYKDSNTGLATVSYTVTASVTVYTSRV